MFFAIYLIIGAIAGISAGLLGIGGGIIVVPALAAVFLHFDIIPSQYIMQMAIGTSLAAMIVTLLSALFAHARRGSVRWDLVRLLLPGLIAGAIVGALIAHYLPSSGLKIFFSVFLAVIAYRLLRSKSDEESRPLPSPLVMRSVASLIGVLSSILGAGGGTMLIPFMLRCRVNVREAAGTSVACGVGIGVAATISFMMLGVTTIHLGWSTGYVYWPAFLGIAFASMFFAPLGTMLAHKLPVMILKRVLAIFLIFVAIEMLFSG